MFATEKYFRKLEFVDYFWNQIFHLKKNQNVAKQGFAQYALQLAVL